MIGEVHHHDRGKTAELEREITIGDGIEAVACDTGKTELLGDPFPVNGEGCSRKGSGTQRHQVEATAQVVQTTGISRQHLHVSEHVMGKEDRLCGLQVRVAWHDDIEVCLGLVKQSRLQLLKGYGDGINFIAQVEAHVKCDLVVS
jgi:hypothetical protein